MSMLINTDISDEERCTSAEYENLAEQYELRLSRMVDMAATDSDETACVLQAWGIRLLRMLAKVTRELEALR